MKKTLLATLFASLFVLASPLSLHAETDEMKKAIENLMPELTKISAEEGDAKAQNELGVMYFKGKGTIKEDKGEALKWFKKSAEQGNAEAQNNLGFLYDEGEGVKEDNAEAMKWFKKAAEQGLAQAQYMLAVKYVGGEGVKEDNAEAMKWFKKAADQGHEDAKKVIPELEKLMVMKNGTATEKSQSDTTSATSVNKADHYTDNGDGTVTDTKTKLMWKQCSEGQGGKECSGKAAQYKWDDAMSKFRSGVSFAGHSDWRMPSKDELRSLVYCSNGTPQEKAWNNSCNVEDYKAGGYQKPTIDQRAFPNTQSGGYWSSTEKDASFAWYVYFDGGDDGWSSRYSGSHVRLVRSGQ